MAVSDTPAEWLDDVGNARLQGRLRADIGQAPTYADAAEYSSNVAVPIDYLATVNLPFTDLASGIELLDRLDPLHPTVLTAGIYAVTAYARGFDLTESGYFTGTLHLDAMDQDAVAVSDSRTATANMFEISLGLTCVYYVPLGGEISFAVRNIDGASTRNFTLMEACIQRLS